MTFLLEFIRFMRARKKYWLVPVFVVTILMAGLMFLSQGSVVAPFIYTIF